MSTLGPQEFLGRDRLREIFTDIAAGEGQHGDFLKSFAEAYVRADPGNEYLLTGAAIALARKYNLDERQQPDVKA